MTLHRIAAPGLVAIIALACVAWAWPTGLRPWRSVGIIVAWAGSGTLIASVLLMVRDPRSARVFGGIDAMYHWHHRSGTIAYALLLLHPLALAADAWFEAPHLAWQTLAPWHTDWPILFGWMSILLMMLGLAGSFAVALPYRVWRTLHYTLALAVIAGVAHAYFLLGNDPAFLALLILGVLALAVRLVLVDRGVTAHPYIVAAVERAADHVVELTLDAQAAAIAVEPGQFVLTAFHRDRGYTEFHPFSVSAVGPRGRMRVAIKALGPCSRHVQDITQGTAVHVQGPFGTFLGSRNSGPQLWIAGGVGITPFVAALRARAPDDPTTLIYLYRNAADAAFREELDTYAASNTRFRLIRIETGDTPPDFDAVLGQLEDIGPCEIQICGPAAMVDALSSSLRRRGIDDRQVHYERFDFR